MKTPKHRATAASILLIAAFLVCPIEAGARRGKSGEAVHQAIAADGEALVVVSLEPPPAATAAYFDARKLREQVARLQDEVLAGLGESDFRMIYRYDLVPGFSGAVSGPGLAALEAHPSVRAVDVGVEIRGHLGDSVPLIGADSWHQQGVTGEGVVVAVLDTGVDTDHPDLADDVVHEACFRQAAVAASAAASTCPDGTGQQLSGAGAAEDDNGHGSHVAGIITSAGQVAPVGVAPDAEILAIKVLGSDLSGRFEDLLAGLSWVMGNHAAADGPFDTRVVNMSVGWGPFVGNGDCDGGDALADMLLSVTGSLRLMGALPIASSGNDSSQTMISAPACGANVLSVGATDDLDVVVAQTNSNANLDLLAPGSFIQSAGLGGGAVILTGTSMAAPHAAGCAALLVEAEEAGTPDQLENLLTTSSVSVTRGNLAFPRLECEPEGIGDITTGTPPAGKPVKKLVLVLIVVLVLLACGLLLARRRG